MSDSAFPTEARKPQRNANGKFLPGASGNPGGSPDRARKALNADTISALHAAFRRGGAQAIDKVMKNNPAIFLKLLVLLVPREMEVTHHGGVKAMSDEALERAIEAIQEMLAKRDQGVVDVTPNAPDIPQIPAPAPKAKRKAKRTLDVVANDDNTGST
jgi:hypothetical protein